MHGSWEPTGCQYLSCVKSHGRRSLCMPCLAPTPTPLNMNDIAHCRMGLTLSGRDTYLVLHLQKVATGVTVADKRVEQLRMRIFDTVFDVEFYRRERLSDHSSTDMKISHTSL